MGFCNFNWSGFNSILVEYMFYLEFLFQIFVVFFLDAVNFCCFFLYVVINLLLIWSFSIAIYFVVCFNWIFYITTLFNFLHSYIAFSIWINFQGFCESIFLSSIGRTIGTSLQSFYRRLMLWERWERYLFAHLEFYLNIMHNFSVLIIYSQLCFFLP